MSSNYPAWITHSDNPVNSIPLTTTSSASPYPSTNLQTLPASSCWRSTSLATQNITFDIYAVWSGFSYSAGPPRSVDIIALVNHNLTSAATINIAAGTTTSYLDFSTTMTWREFTAFKWLTSPVTYRYWRVQITDAANPDGFIEVGYLVCGVLTKPDFTFRQGWSLTDQRMNSKVISEFGSATIEEVFRRQQLKFSFGPLTAERMLLITQMVRSTKRNVYSVFFLPMRGSSEAYFGKFTDPLTIDSTFRKFTELSFNEDSFGHALET